MNSTEGGRSTAVPSILARACSRSRANRSVSSGRKVVTVAGRASWSSESTMKRSIVSDRRCRRTRARVGRGVADEVLLVERECCRRCGLCIISGLLVGGRGNGSARRRAAAPMQLHDDEHRRRRGLDPGEAVRHRAGDRDRRVGEARRRREAVGAADPDARPRTAPPTARPLRTQPWITSSSPTVATTSDNHSAPDDRDLVDHSTAGSSNIRLATIAPRQPPTIWAADVGRRCRGSSACPRAGRPG